MRALFCLGGPGFICGPNVWLTRHLPLLRSRGIEASVLYLSTDPDAPCPFRATLEERGIATRPVCIGRFMEENVPAVLEGIAAEQPDIFVPNCSAPAYYAARFAREAGIRTIGTIHSDDPFYHDMLDLFVRGPEPWRLDAVVSVSHYLHEVALDAATPVTRVMHATYGTPVDGACATAPGDLLTLLYVGRLAEWQKRITRLTHRLCDATLTVPGVRAVLYGDGPNEDDVRAIVAARGAADRVRLGGALDSDAVMPAMRQGHALVLLSDFEGLAIALMEAMACGVVPIISRMRSGTADVIEHDVNALVVDPDDETSVVDAVRRLREEPGLWARLSAAARDTIVTGGFTAGDCAARWIELFEQMGPRTRFDDVRVPDPDKLDLPPVCARPLGFRTSDHRDPRGHLRRASDASRPIYIWGAGAAGRQVLASAATRETGIAGVIDRRANGSSGVVDGARLYPPAHLAVEVRNQPRPFVVIASVHDVEIGGELTAMGFTPDRDFISA